MLANAEQDTVMSQGLDQHAPKGSDASRGLVYHIPRPPLPCGRTGRRRCTQRHRSGLDAGSAVGVCDKGGCDRTCGYLYSTLPKAQRTAQRRAANYTMCPVPSWHQRPPPTVGETMRVPKSFFAVGCHTCRVTPVDSVTLPRPPSGETSLNLIPKKP